MSAGLGLAGLGAAILATRGTGTDPVLLPHPVESFQRVGSTQVNRNDLPPCWPRSSTA